MMERICSTDGVVFYRSTLLAGAGAPHAFSTRIGGVSEAPFHTLNLGNPSGQSAQDSPAHIRENYRRLLRAAGFDRQILTRVSQVHGTRVIEATRDSAQTPAVEADAIVTCDNQCAASVRVADCVPVLLATRDGRRVAAVHSGWRGVVAGVVPRAVKRLCGPTHVPEQLLVAVGPCIGFDAFEVGPEVLEQFVRIWGMAAPVRSAGAGKGLVNLRRAVEMQLLQLGIPPEQIDISGCCTWRDSEEFYSHRRDRGLTGRMAAVIACL
ncbi:MAG: peptidoglycan editing factor PgeF [Tepidisphaeraceae bacterium]|jgi:hypothetical protein